MSDACCRFLTPQQYFRSGARKPRKRFGQHFLAQPATAERIVREAGLTVNDLVVEVGPGLGALTQFILPVAGGVHLVELDRDLAEYLENCIKCGPCPVTMHQQDILSFDFLSLSRSAGQRLVVMGNLPYNIGSPLLFHLLESAAAIDRAVFMVQREVGERLTAHPGGKDYGVLTVLLGVYARVAKLFIVGPKQFYPPPHVDSLVLRLDFYLEPLLDEASFAFLRQLVNSAFQQRRKTLHNSLRGWLGKRADTLRDAFAAAGIDPQRRPETLSREEFMELGAALKSTLEQ